MFVGMTIHENKQISELQCYAGTRTSPSWQEDSRFRTSEGAFC
jgi:hypothetical protein